MIMAFRKKAADLRCSAADPRTDLWLVRPMLETAAEMEAVADQLEAEFQQRGREWGKQDQN
jgi:hypothetical protein